MNIKLFVSSLTTEEKTELLRILKNGSLTKEEIIERFTLFCTKFESPRLNKYANSRLIWEVRIQDSIFRAGNNHGKYSIFFWEDISIEEFVSFTISKEEFESLEKIAFGE